MDDAHLRDADDPEETHIRQDLSYLWTQKPFNRLGWWPPAPAERAGMTVYRVPLDWHQPEISPHQCYFFVSPGTDKVYVAADGF